MENSNEEANILLQIYAHIGKAIKPFRCPHRDHPNANFKGFVIANGVGENRHKIKVEFLGHGEKFVEITIDLGQATTNPDFYFHNIMEELNRAMMQDKAPSIILPTNIKPLAGAISEVSH